MFTSQPYDGVPREGVIIISKENFKNILNPLLNTHDGVGATSIDKALEKRPYFDDEGYLKINPNTKKLDYHPFNISKKLSIENRDTPSVYY
uniref:Uncharacterized protein n=1 Tax=Rhizophagus irregularis (strain DAOM 181602 / DAOM 197198 / MUCL 43194) TaxID=747089 RepID=U9U9W5_RHIID